MAASPESRVVRFPPTARSREMVRAILEETAKTVQTKAVREVLLGECRDRTALRRR